ncbi:MAG: hypothetical protein WC654_02920 [Patescibacteria group bacterium]
MTDEQHEAPSLTKRERREKRKQEHANLSLQDQRTKTYKTVAKTSLVIIAMLVGLYALVQFIKNAPVLPPTSTQGHIEEMPSSHMVNDPIPDNIQRHMLEHADGKGKPGVLIQYNCVDYSCPDDLVERLSAIVLEYPDHVYLAPNTYSGMIILTKLGSYKILDELDESAIRAFIE